MKHAVRAFYAICDATGERPYPWGAANGFNNARIRAFVSGKTRPTGDLLTALATAWPDPKHGREILAAHLKDEVELAGLSPSQFIIDTASGTTTDQVAESLHIIEAAVGHDTDLITPLIDLANLLRSTLAEQPALRVAEDRQALFGDPRKIQPADRAAAKSEIEQALNADQTDRRRARTHSPKTGHA